MSLIAKVVLLIFVLHISISKELAPRITLNDGNKIPVIGLGTAVELEKEEFKMREVVNWAVSAGYRHIDTAAIYGTEPEIGKGIADVIKKNIVKREDLFVTTKLWNDRHARDQVLPALRESLARLGLDYVDLYLIHWPISIKSNGSVDDIDHLETWKGMEEAKRLGLAKSIGVSNFDAAQLDRLISNSEVKPAVNQIEVNPTLTQVPLITHCQKLGIVVTAYSPLGYLVSRDVPNAPPPKLDDPSLLKIAQKYEKTPVQIVLRYLVDRGLVPIPKSTNKKRIIENIDLFDFQLSEEEIDTINNFNQNFRVVENPL